MNYIDISVGADTINVIKKRGVKIMKKCRLFVALVALVLLAGSLSSCDNRSQLEKDADAAAKKMSQALR